MKTRIAAAKASTTFIIAICLAIFCMALPASADGDATSGDHPSLSGTTWKIVEKWTRQDGSGGETTTYVRFYDHPWVNARGDEGKPLKTMVHYPYKKNQKVPVSDTLNGWWQDGGNVELYISGVPHKCEFVDEATMKGTFSSAKTGISRTIELTRTTDPAAMKQIDKEYETRVQADMGSKTPTPSKRNEIRVSNPNDFSATVTVRERGYMAETTWVVPAQGSAGLFFSGGFYEIFFTFSDEPSALYQGKGFLLMDNGIEIKLSTGTAADSGLRRVN